MIPSFDDVTGGDVEGQTCKGNIECRQDTLLIGGGVGSLENGNRNTCILVLSFIRGWIELHVQM